MRVKIFTIHHLPPERPVEAPYFTDFVLGRDDLAGGITDRVSYAEMRCHYWVWKNIYELKITHVGFQHYRRWVRWDGGDNEKVSRTAFNAVVPSLAAFGWHWLEANGRGEAGYDVVATTRVDLGCTLEHHYSGIHDRDHWGILKEELMREGYTDQELHVYSLTPCNIFAMRVELFDAYMQHWWAIISRVEPRITVDQDGYQSRALGFMSERIFTLWLNKQQWLRRRTLGLLTTG